MTLWIVLFIVFDVVVTAVVLTVVLRRRAARAGDLPAGVFDLGRIRTFTDALHPRVGEFVRANWNGHDEELPGVLSALLDEAARLAREQQVDLERDVLKRVVTHSISSHNLAAGSVVREAMKQVA